MKRSLSLVAFLMIALALLLVRATHRYDRILTWDTFGYYLYLPAQFIYHDLPMQESSWIDSIYTTYEPSSTRYQFFRLENGNWVMRYPAGLALLQTPFFFAGHAVALLSDYPADGMSAPYQSAFIWGAMCYTLLGLWWLRKILLVYFDEKWTAGLLLLVVFGTNYLQIAGFAGALPHNFLFTLYAGVFWFTYRWHLHYQRKDIFITGLLIGIITICRPNELLVVLIPLLWGVYNLETLRQKLVLLKNKWGQLLLFIAGGALGILPQLLYWKKITGSWLFYSYRDPGVGFDFFSPHTLDFLFSFRKGWFVYTPLMLLAVIGFAALYKRQKPLFWGLLVYFLLNLYVVSSWSVWWYAGGSFSSRSMVSAYGLLLLPLGFLLQQWWGYRFGKYVVLILCGFLVALNIFQTWQYSRGIIDGERMTAAYYFRIFGKTGVTTADRALLLPERPVTAYEHFTPGTDFVKREGGSLTFENGGPAGFENNIVTGFGHESNTCFRLDEHQIYTPEIRKTYAEITQGDYAWLRVSAWVYVADSLPDEPPLLVMSFQHKDAPYKYTSSENQTAGIRKGQWSKIEIDYITPDVRSTEDYLKVYFWYRGKNPVYVDDLRMDIYEPAVTVNRP